MRAAAWLALLGSTAYAALAGFSVPTQRAMLMVAVVMLAILAGRRIAPIRLLAVALVLVLLLDTAAVLAPGFWLSFGAVVVIILFLNRFDGLSRWRQLLLLQFLLSVCLMPLTAWFFGEASLVSPLANLVAVPVMSLLVIPGALLLAVLASFSSFDLAWLVWGLDAVLGWLFDWLRWLSGWSLASVSVPTMNLYQWCALLLALGMFLRWRSVGSVLLGGSLLLLAVFWPREKLEEGAMRIAFLDVGQGLSVVIETHAHTLVYDLGPRFSDHFTAAEAVVSPYLRWRGINRVDTLVISHEDMDHRGDLDGFLDEMPVERVLAGLRVPHVTSMERCQAGQDWQWDGAEFEVLHPISDTQVKDNDQSCVLKVSSGSGVDLLLTGDITKSVEAQLALRSDIDADILQVPHHGSDSSSSAGFINAVAPEMAVATLGHGNRWRFPKEEVLGRYAEFGTDFLRTDRSGAVIVTVPAKRDEYRVTLWRDEQRRFWKVGRIAD